jgi:hypothetical protein
VPFVLTVGLLPDRPTPTHTNHISIPPAFPARQPPTGGVALPASVGKPAKKFWDNASPQAPTRLLRELAQLSRNAGKNGDCVNFAGCAWNRAPRGYMHLILVAYGHW